MPSGRRALVRRLGRGVRHARTGARRRGDVRAPVGGQAAELLPRPVRSGRRGQGRGPDLHLLRRGGGRRPDEPLARPGRDARAAGGEVRRRDARPHALRRPLLDGPARLPARRDRRPAHRLRLRRGLDADHDPDGPGRARRARRRRRVRPLPAHRRRSARGGRGQRAVAVQRGEVHRPLPRDARDLVLRLGLRRQRAAGQEVPGAADRLGHGPRRGLDGRAHADPQAHLARGRRQVRHRRVPQRVRQDEPGDADPRDRGLDRRDRRRRHRLDEVRRRRPALRDQPRGGLLRRRARDGRGDEPERDGDGPREHDLHELREDRRRRRLVGGDDEGDPRCT